MQFIDLTVQYDLIRDNVQQRMNKVLEHARFIMGPEVEELEERLAHYCGVKHAIACGSGTDALQMALMVLGLVPGDEVIMPAFSYFATAEVCLLLKLKPIFVDIDARTYNIDPQRIAEAITPRTKAIMPVSLFGQCADFDAINAIAAQHGLFVIEDGAQSFGASYKGRRSLSLSTIGCTSFFPSKTLGCYGDGGMCFTNDENIAKKLRMIRVHGQSEIYVHDIVGINSRLDTLQAAVLLAKFELFTDEAQQREQIAACYDAHLTDLVDTPYIEPYNRSIYSQYTIATDHRDTLQQLLKTQNIPSNIYYSKPMPTQTAYAGQGYKTDLFLQTESACKRVLSLPMHPYLKPLEQEQIIKAVQNAILTDNHSNQHVSG